MSQPLDLDAQREVLDLGLFVLHICLNASYTCRPLTADESKCVSLAIRKMTAAWDRAITPPPLPPLDETGEGTPEVPF